METNMSRLLHDKVAIVTGGGTGIGEAVCKLFAKHGARVIVNGLPGDPAEEVAAEIEKEGGLALGVEADCGTEEGARRCVTAALNAFDRVDVLVANAGLYPEEMEIQDFPKERFAELIRSHVMGTWFCVRAALPELRKSRGSIVAMGSEAGLRPYPGAVSYCSTKGWIHNFIRGVAAEQAAYGVRANVVAPGPIDTEMTRPSKGHMKLATGLLVPAYVPLGRRGTPEEVANVCLFLASDLASYVTGSIYPVDGGSTATGGMPGLGATSAAKRTPRGTVELRHQYEGRGTLRKTPSGTMAPGPGTPRTRKGSRRIVRS